MGRPKQLLAWGEHTVIATVVSNLGAAGANPVICVVGHERKKMQDALRGTSAVVVFNAAYTSSEVLASYQMGIARLAGEGSRPGALLALCDQPHVGSEIIRQVIDQAFVSPDRIIIPSHDKRRGHPIYLPRRLWSGLLALSGDESLRSMLNNYAEDIKYVNVESDAILHDMDTPAEYERLRPEAR